MKTMTLILFLVLVLALAGLEAAASRLEPATNPIVSGAPLP